MQVAARGGSVGAWSPPHHMRGQRLLSTGICWSGAQVPVMRAHSQDQVRVGSHGVCGEASERVLSGCQAGPRCSGPTTSAGPFLRLSPGRAALRATCGHSNASWGGRLPPGRAALRATCLRVFAEHGFAGDCVTNDPVDMTQSEVTVVAVPVTKQYKLKYLLAGLVVAFLVGGVGGGLVAYREKVLTILQEFVAVIPAMGPKGLGVFMALYLLLEMLSIPVMPLTFSAGVMYGAPVGALICCTASTVAATLAFIIARYGAKQWVVDRMASHKQFVAIDRRIGQDSFRVVAMLRLSPIMPLSLANYLYGVTSVQLIPYIMATFLGLLPGAFMQCSAAVMGQQVLGGVGTSSGPPVWQLALPLVLLFATVSYIVKLAGDSLKELEDEADEA